MPQRRRPQIDPLSEITLTQQLANIIVSEIKSGTYSVGDQLPSEGDLSYDHGDPARGIPPRHGMYGDLSRVTARRSLLQLEKQGWVRGLPGRGWFVVNDNPEPKPEV